MKALAALDERHRVAARVPRAFVPLRRLAETDLVAAADSSVAGHDARPPPIRVRGRHS